MIKQLRKFTNMTILCITDDKAFQSQMVEKFSDAKELLFLQNIDDCDQTYDILVLDFDIENSLEILKAIKLKKPMLPKIVLLDGDDEEDILSCINYGAYSILAKPIFDKDLRYSMIMALNQSKRVDKISISEDIFYDSYRERFYNKDGVINFTRFEFDLLKLLLDNPDRIISYDEIKLKVWKEKKMSIFTMRNVINKIRNKTYYEIIRNNSSTGYQIDILK